MLPGILISSFIIILIAILWVATSKSSGDRGEDIVKSVIGKNIENERYVINNLTLRNGDKTCQIDHIVINPRGIFVIETKNYSGEIYGAENQLQWTQVLAYGKIKNKFYNPIKQNATHVYCVKKIIGNMPVYSLVVFVKWHAVHVEANNVIPLALLNMKLQQGSSVLSEKEMKNAYDSLLANKIDISKQTHIKNIRETQQNLARGICPRCGGLLVKKNGAYGDFYGCSNFPKCKFSKKI